MTAPTTSIAWPLAKQVAALLAEHENCATAAVYPMWPGDKAIKPEFVVIEDLKVTGIGVAGWQAGRKQRNATVQMVAKCYVSNKRTADALMERLGELVAAVEDVFADDLTLDTEGVIYGEVTGIEFDTFESNDGGFLGSAAVAVSVVTRLH